MLGSTVSMPHTLACLGKHVLESAYLIHILSCICSAGMSFMCSTCGCWTGMGAPTILFCTNTLLLIFSPFLAATALAFNALRASHLH